MYLSQCKCVLDKLEMSYKRPQMLKDFYINLGERLKQSVIYLMEVMTNASEYGTWYRYEDV